MMANAPFCLAYHSVIETTQAASQLYPSTDMNTAHNLLIFWMPKQHSKYCQYYNNSKFKYMEGQIIKQKSNKIVGNFILGQTIGEGTFNKVKIARHIHSQEQVAIKLIDKSKIKTPADHQRLIKQLKILRKARHPNIIQLFEILEDQQYYYVITEHASRGELFDQIVKSQKLQQYEASRYLQHILNAIEYMQEMGVAHRDLKPENVLLDYKFNVKIIDFGLSNIFSKGQTLKTACGSPCYAAPQMLSGNPYDPSKIDIWSAGIILYAMCFGYLPFDNQNSSQLYQMIRSGKYDIPDHASEQLIDILSKILQVDPKKRATIQQIRKHSFCKFNPNDKISGIIPGLSIIPFQESISIQMKELSIETKQLENQISNNKHTDLTSTYYIFLHQWLRQKNQTILNYFISKNHLINRYKIIQKVKENYQKRQARLIYQELSKSRKRVVRNESQKKKRSKTSQKKKIKTGVETSTKFHSKQIYISPQRKKMSFYNRNSKSNKKSENKKAKKKLIRS